MSRTILIVDDNEINRKLLRVRLEAEGYATLQAGDGIEALELLARKTVDSVITDLLMPRMDGYRLCYKMRTDKRLKAIPIIIHSSTHTSPTDENLAAEVGADKFIKRPAPAQVILDALQEVATKPRPDIRKRSPSLKEAEVMKEYSEVLIKKLEEKNLELEVRNQDLQTLHEISQTILTTPDLKSALDRLLDKILPAGGFDLGAIRILDRNTEILEPVAGKGFLDPGNMAALRRRLHESGRDSAVDRMINEKQSLVFETLPEWHGMRVMRAEKIQSAILVPIHSQEQTLGILQLGSRKQMKFQPTTVHILETVGNQIGVAIQKARLYEETRKNLERIRALHEVDVAITSTLDLHAILTILLEKIDACFPYETASLVRLLEKESRKLAHLASRNMDVTNLARQTDQSLGSRAKKIIEAQAPLAIRNLQTDPRQRNRDFYVRNGLVSYLGVPLITKDDVLGILSLYTKQEHDFTDEEIDFLVTLASQAAIAIHNAQLYKSTKMQAAELEIANKVKDQFLSVMSHELRTPLTGIMGYTSLIIDGLLGEINPEQANALQRVAQQSVNLLGLINAIMQATHLEAGSIIVEKQAVDLKAFLDDLRSSYNGPLDKEVVLVWDYPPTLPIVQTDGGKLRDILRHLIDNGIKFTAQGSVTISARLTERGRQVTDNSKQTIEVLPTADGFLPTGRHSVEFKVADTGIGISKECLPVIFDKFAQADSSETRLYGGTGLGLYIVKHFTDLLGGTVTIESEPDEGSTFTVRIPV